MKTAIESVQMVPIEQIRVINPRSRDPKQFARVVDSIKNLGLKKPIKISLRSSSEGSEQGYDLVYGQGRIEACRALGHAEIPAIVVNLSKEDRLLQSLVENLARRIPSHGDLIAEIVRLKEKGYSNVQIGKKLDMADCTVGGYLALIGANEERLITAALKGAIPMTVAMEISKADTPEQQRAFLKAYESGDFNSKSIRVVKRLIASRNTCGTTKSRNSQGKASDGESSSEEMVSLYQRQTHKMRNVVHKTRICETKILIVVSAFRKLLGDEQFKNLLKAANLATFPQPLADKLKN
jgi:ParB family chromosome partitioning protein